jgi:hypothetical protein
MRHNKKVIDRIIHEYKLLDKLIFTKKRFSMLHCKVFHAPVITPYNGIVFTQAPVAADLAFRPGGKAHSVFDGACCILNL